MPTSPCCLPWPWCCCCSWEWSAPMLPCHVSRVVTCRHVYPSRACPHCSHLPILFLLKNKKISESESSSVHWSRTVSGRLLGSAWLQQPGLYSGYSHIEAPLLLMCPDCGCGLATADLESAACWWPCQCTVDIVQYSVHCIVDTPILSRGHTPLLA